MGDVKEKEAVKDVKERAKPKVPRLKLAYDPNKIKSRLFESTSAMKGKMKVKSARGSATPQVKSNSKNIKKTMGRGSATPQARRVDYSAVKSKLDTGRGLKRRLVWKGNGGDKEEADSSEPAQKKRKMSTKKGWQ